MITLADLDKQGVLGLVEDSKRNFMTHHALWFRAVEQQLGLDEALRLEDAVCRRARPIRDKRLLQRMEQEGHSTFAAYPRDWTIAELKALLVDMAKNWIAQDGIWFQAVEQSHGMVMAKECNDQALRTYGVVEAKRIVSRLGIPANGGLEGLDQARRFKMYAHLIRQSTRRVDDNKLVLERHDCRVQSGRKRGGLPEYNCRSACEIELTGFARAIDPRFTTRCLCSPPDERPAGLWCSWEFTLA